MHWHWHRRDQESPTAESEVVMSWAGQGVVVTFWWTQVESGAKTTPFNPLANAGIEPTTLA